MPDRPPSPAPAAAMLKRATAWIAARTEWISNKLGQAEWRSRLAYGVFAALAFLVALRWTFPSEAMKERLIFEAGSRGWQIDVDDVSAGGVLGFRARGVKLESHAGLAIPIEDVTASLRILPLLAGRRSVSFDARIYDGRVEGSADLSGASRRLVVDAAGVDLGQALPLRKAAGLDLLGRVTATADLELPADPNGRPKGRVDVGVKDAGIAGGQLPIPGMTGGLTLPKIGLGELAASVKVADGKATFERLDAKGGDAEIQTESVYFLVQPRMEFAPVSGRARVKVAEAFWKRSGTEAFKALTDMTLAQSRGRDGAWNFTIMGSVGHPLMQPAPQSP